MREFLVEVTILYPTGESLDDWKLIGRFYEDLPEGQISDAVKSIGDKIAVASNKWVKENPDD